MMYTWRLLYILVTLCLVTVGRGWVFEGLLCCLRGSRDAAYTSTANFSISVQGLISFCSWFAATQHMLISCKPNVFCSSRGLFTFYSVPRCAHHWSLRNCNRYSKALVRKVLYNLRLKICLGSNLWNSLSYVRCTSMTILFLLPAPLWAYHNVRPSWFECIWGVLKNNTI